ncbi:MAG: carbamate kinase [Desulfobacteraceae bacterium 4572_130]|nr:MAG: carbamate kinase [Desulfobacteraceae bacterium 4572_130]
MKKLVIVALGGNSLIRDKEHLTINDQYCEIQKTVNHIVDIIEAGYKVVVTHGNGPQVGFILARSEIAYKYEKLHFVPLLNCVADTQGAIGFQIQLALNNELKKRNLKQKAVTIVTQVKVAKNDYAFKNPEKPIGNFYTHKEIDEVKKKHPDWIMISDAGRGYRRVVPSPKPLEIIELDMVKNLMANGHIVITVGGGGIPVVQDDNGYFKGIDAVIDKDFASALLATNLGAEMLVISTSVDKVCLNFGKKDETPLSQITYNQAKEYIKQGHFALGSMLPKIDAILFYLKNGGQKAIITKPEDLKKAIIGKAGTHIKIDK